MGKLLIMIYSLTIYHDACNTHTHWIMDGISGSRVIMSCMEVARLATVLVRISTVVPENTNDRDPSHAQWSMMLCMYWLWMSCFHITCTSTSYTVHLCTSASALVLWLLAWESSISPKFESAYKIIFLVFIITVECIWCLCLITEFWT